jgi:hypothetical protein
VGWEGGGDGWWAYEDAVVVTSDDGETRDGEGLGRIALSNDEGALAAVLTASLVGVVELGDARQAHLVGMGVGVGVRVRRAWWGDGGRGSVSVGMPRHRDKSGEHAATGEARRELASAAVARAGWRAVESGGWVVPSWCHQSS